MKSYKNFNGFGELNLKLTFNIVFFSVAVSVITATAYALVPKNHKDTLTFAVATFAMSAGGLGAFYAYKSLSHSANYQMVDRTLSYIQRWNDPIYLPLKETSVEIFRYIEQQPLDQQDQLLIEYFENNPKKKQRVIAILNFLTEVALSIEEEVVEEEILRNFFCQIVLDYCENFHAFINQRRGNRHNKDVYKALIELRDKWNR